MTSDNTGGQTLRETLGMVLRPVVSALVTGKADPPPKNQQWPSRLRWTRWIGIGRLPFGPVVAVLDIVIAVILLPSTYSLLRTEAPGYPGLDLGLVAVAMTLPVVLRHRHPVAAWRVIVVALILFPGRDYLTVPYVPAGVMVAMLCLYSVAVRSPRDVTIGAGVISIAGVWFLDLPTGFVASVMILVSLLLGYLVRERRASRQELAEQERRHQDAEAVLTERQRIARELHDVVAHHMSMIAIQAEAAPYKVPDMHDKTRADLAEIRSTALEALTEMRRILGVLRSAEGAETAPQPSLDRIDELVANARNTGLTVDAQVTGRPGELPPGVGLTAYRILQEALSNAMRHAPGSRVRIEVDHRPGVVRLSVVNGPAPDGSEPTESPPGGGHGLIGMRERTAMLGGELTARPTGEGGFAVAATLPLKGDS